jgi:hypothetical protein
VGRPRPLQAALHRAERLGRAVAAARPELVLCHADLHLANLLVDAEGRLWVVDWDGLQLTPRERDLLFATGPNGRGSWRATGPSPWTGRPWPTTAGSGWCRSWPTYGGRVLDDRLGDDTRRHALEELRRLFAPGDVVEVARRADQGLMVS